MPAMATHTIRIFGDPVLKRPTAPVTDIDGALVKLVDAMFETMYDANGAGLAANQVYEPVQVCAIEVKNNPRYPYKPNVPLTVLVNPKITPATTETDEDWEGCLSVPDMRGQVPRYTRVKVEAYGRDGRPLRFTAAGFHARVIQHECDHLDGKVYLDRMRSLETLSFLPEFHKHWLGRDEADVE